MEVRGTGLPRTITRMAAEGSAWGQEDKQPLGKLVCPSLTANSSDGRSAPLSFFPEDRASAPALQLGSLEDQERRVRRRHRKRLARIVVDHWVAFARGRALLRLAARHWSRTVLRHSLARWASVLELRREQSISAIVFSTRMAFRVLGRSLAQWSAYRSARLAKSEAKRWAEQWRGRRAMSRTFSALQEYAPRGIPNRPTHTHPLAQCVPRCGRSGRGSGMCWS